MNKIERVRAALRQQPVDRVPVGLWLHFPPAQAHGQAAVDAHLDYYRATGLDFIKVMNEHPFQADVTIASPADWRRLRPVPLSAPFFQGQLDVIKGIVDAVAGECLVITTVFGPYAAGGHTSGERITEHLRADPQAVSGGLAAIAESLAGFCLACLDAGAAGIYFSAQGGERDRLTADQFFTYVKPHEVAVLEAIRDASELNLLHICGNNIRLTAYADYPSHAVNWAVTPGNLTLKQGQSLFRRTVVGGLDNRGVVVRGPRHAIQEETRRLIADFGPQGLILGADCTLPTAIDLDHIRAVVEATAP